jgi:hypothetical protein
MPMLMKTSSTGAGPAIAFPTTDLEAEQYYLEATESYKTAKNPFGLARVMLLESEWKLTNQTDQVSASLVVTLKEAFRIFETLPASLSI